MKNKLALSALFALALVLAACAPEAMPATEAPVMEAATDPYASSGGDSMSTTASVEVGDQPIENGTVTVAKVNAVADGWLVIHIEAEGKPGAVIGYAQVPAGESQ